MNNQKSDMTPDEIRSIREYLGLSQVEAGELIGGGLRAFTKYEAGAVKPSASVVNLLRLLEADPTLIATMQGRKPRPVTTGSKFPFDVTGVDIAAMSERTFPQLLRLLLSAEAQAHGLPLDGIHVASNIHAAERGEDGRIIWKGGPPRTQFLPSRLNQFQLKASKILPAAAAKDVLTKNREVKEMVRSVLEARGNYIMLCAHPYPKPEIDRRKVKILDALRSAGMTIYDDQVDFRDTDQIATWVNRHPSVATWVKEHTKPGTIGPFRSWGHWANRTEHAQSPWVDDQRLRNLRDWLREKISEPRKIARIVGLSGIGKSRLTLEALRPTPEEEARGVFLSDIVMYAVWNPMSAESISQTVQNLADSAPRAVVVVDDCDAEAHQILTGMVLRSSSRLSLVTIDHEVPVGTVDESVLIVDEAPESVTEGIVSHVLPGLLHEDRSRLEHFSKGFPKIAILVGQIWRESRPIAHATDDRLVDEFVLGRNPRDRELVLGSAALLAAFPLVDVDSPNVGQFKEIAGLGRDLTSEDLYAAASQLIDRGVAQRRGRYITLQPRPIALRLAERQWKQWSPSKWDRVLSGDIDPWLKVMAAKQLALLDTTDISPNVVANICRYGGPFDRLEVINRPGSAEVLSSLAEIDPDAVVEQIDRAIQHVDELSEVVGETRNHLVWALEKIAFHSHTFEDGARLLLRLASSESSTWNNHGADRYKALFPLLLGNTVADGHSRLSALDEGTHTDDPVQRLVVVEALLAGLETHHFSRIAGAESQGSSPALREWRPATDKEAIDYVAGCANRLAQFAQLEDSSGAKARAGLGLALRALVAGGLIDEVEQVVRRVTAVVDFWPEALRSLRSVLTYDGEKTDPEVTERVIKLIQMAQPESLESRIRFYVTEMPWDFTIDSEQGLEERYRREVGTIRKLAAEALSQPATLKKSLAQLSRGRHRMALEFGTAVAELADSPIEWLEYFIQAVVEVPEEERNHELVSGFVVGLAKVRPREVNSFKSRASQSRELVPAQLRVSFVLGLTRSDIQLAMGALQDGLLPPQQFNQWSFGGKLAEVSAPDVAPLIDVLLEHSPEAFSQAVNLMGMYSFGAPEKLLDLRPQVLKMAENACRWRSIRDTAECEYHFERIIGWFLGEGRKNPDACAVALALAKSAVKVEKINDDFLLKPVLPKLLSEFPEITWPLIGHTIVSDPRRAMRLRYMLGDPYSFGNRSNPVIMNLPEDTLIAWCYAHPDRAPAFLATILPVLARPETSTEDRSLHPFMARLLDEFGEREGVQAAVESNIHTFGWTGSMATYYTPYKDPLSKLLRHPKPKVRRWARRLLRRLDGDIENARNEDEQREALGEI